LAASRVCLFRTTVALVLGSLALALVPAPLTAADELSPPGERNKVPTIRVDASVRGKSVSTALLGVNHRWTRNGFGLWDADEKRPEPKLVKLIRRAGISTMRYPGGTTAALFDWNKAIGRPSKRGCQIEGHWADDGGFAPVRTRLAYGPDEFMRVAHATGAAPLIMTPFVNQSPGKAANWVEYMNAEVGTNPGGGKAWARVRAANGHRAPYNVRRWEVGNESHVAPRRYGFGGKTKALRQYANGGLRNIKGEALGKRCNHRTRGTASNGERDQVFEVLYTPANIEQITVDGRPWRRVSDLSDVSGTKRVYEANGKTGRVLFGDGRHGRIPKKGAVVRADYRNRFAGFFRFARAMKRVDKRINVCASWGTPSFAKVTRGRRYDCASAHPLTNFNGVKGKWRNALEGHDRMMLGLAHRKKEVRAIMRTLPPKASMWLTEFQPIHGHDEAYPSWSASMGHAVYMTSSWLTWLKFGVRLGTGGDLLASAGGSVLGSPRAWTFSVEATARQAITPMFKKKGKVVRSRVQSNPSRLPRLNHAGGYKGLDVVATRGRDRAISVLAVNRLPSRDVRARVVVKGSRLRGLAKIRRVAAKHFTDHNPVGKARRVQLQKSKRRVGRGDFSIVLPAHSVTVIRLPAR
jgi:alpha-N-arabinofuranosidase